MKTILNTDNGNPYVGVEVDDKILRFVLLQYTERYTIHLDKKIIPKLIEFLQRTQNDETTTCKTKHTSID